MILLDRKEYGEVCSAINTMHANKIPNEGNILYKNHLYEYTHNKWTHRIEFVGRWEIESNISRIKWIMEEKYAYRNRKKAN